MSVQSSRSARLSINFTLDKHNARVKQIARNSERDSGRTSRSSNGSSIYAETTKDVMQLSTPAFRCGNDVILFDEKRRSGARTHKSSIMRSGDYYDPIRAERVRLSRYNELYDPERAERQDRLKYARESLTTIHGAQYPPFLHRASKMRQQPNDFEQDNKYDDPFIPPAVRAKQNEQKQEQTLNEKKLQKNGDEKKNDVSKKNENNKENLAGNTLDKISVHEEIYGNGGQNYPYDNAYTAGYGNSGYIGNQPYYKQGYRGDHSNTGQYDDGYLPPLNISYQRNNYQSSPRY